jgi:hypothetical protein
MNSLQAMAAAAPANWESKYHFNLWLLYLFSFFRQFDIVTIGLIFAPQKDPEKQIAISKHPAAWAST